MKSNKLNFVMCTNNKISNKQKKKNLNFQKNIDKNIILKIMVKHNTPKTLSKQNFYQKHKLLLAGIIFKSCNCTKQKKNRLLFSFFFFSVRCEIWTVIIRHRFLTFFFNYIILNSSYFTTNFALERISTN